MRTVDQSKITRKTHRAKLPERKTAHYRELRDGLHLGYSKSKADAEGRWAVRERQSDGRYKERSIAMADELIGADEVKVLTYDQSVAASDSRAAEIHTGMPTFYEAIDEWAESKRATLTNSRSLSHMKWTVRDAKAAFPDIRLDRIKARDIEKWHRASVATSDEHTARSQRASADRKLGAVLAKLAILNRSHNVHGLKIDKAWNSVERFGKVSDVGNLRTNRLTLDKTRNLIDAAEADFRDFIILAAETGARPSELYTVECRNWDGQTMNVSGKTGRRAVLVSAMAQKLLIRSHAE
jgi:integrase